MRKYIIPIVVCVVSMILWSSYYKLEYASAANNLSNHSISFRVVANSNSQLDQNIKKYVRDEICTFINNCSSNLDSAKKVTNFIESNKKLIVSKANKALARIGVNYSATLVYQTDSFPDRTYNDIDFPSGYYTGYILILGKGKGHNWWCVLYPPLCFVDTSTGVVPDSSKERLKESLTDTQYQTIVKYRFKYLTFLNDLISSK